MKNVFSFCNQKGGVGKTTSAINVATLLGKLGHRVLILDMDSQANATSGLGIEKPSIEFTTYQLIVENVDPLALVKQTAFDNVFLIPSNPDLAAADLELINRERREYCLKEKIETLKSDFEAILIDCPPSLGMITINSLVSSDYIIIPLQCEYYALEGLGQLLHSFELVKQNLNNSLEIGGVILTMADFRTNLTQQVIEEVRNYFKEKVFQSVIPRSVKLSEAPSFGKPAVIYDPHNKGSKSYEEIAHEFEKRFLNFEIRNPKIETNSKLESSNISNESSEHSDF
ncbi:MAG: ParA family protein [Candidatus Omnitrophica bacterium]|nr:ParA family protein [Candidatus Omnitrophota bacterium]